MTARPRRLLVKRRSGGRSLSALGEVASTNALGHVIRVRAVRAPVVELDHRILQLAADPLRLVPLAAAEGSIYDLVIDTPVCCATAGLGAMPAVQTTVRVGTS